MTPTPTARPVPTASPAVCSVASSAPVPSTSKESRS